MPLTIGELFRRLGHVHGGRIAATLDGTCLRFGKLNDRANQLAHVLREQGIERGDRVVWWGDTTLDALPVFAALSKLGAVFAPINARLGAAEASPLAGFARAALLISDAPHAEAAALVAKNADLPRLAHTGGAVGPGLDLDRARDGARTREIETPGLTENDPHVIFFTSGSTGLPKGVVLSHRANFLRSFQGFQRGGGDRTVCMFPLFHMAGWTLALAAWQAAEAIGFVRAPSADALLQAVAQTRATRLYCIPAVWSRILSADRTPYDLSSLRSIDTGTSATPPELIAGLRDAFPGTETKIFYGSTEAGPGTVLEDADLERKPGSVGLAAPGVDLRLSEAGEVCLRSDYLMDGYFDNPEATREALRDGWYHTGDLGDLDPDGTLRIVGRLRDIIRSGGESIAPAEVEAALSSHPDVSELAVVGIPDPEWGELVCAAVVPHEGRVPTLDQLRVHCEGRLASYKQPRRLALVEALPRTPATGQVQRSLLIERILSQ